MSRGGQQYIVCVFPVTVSCMFFYRCVSAQHVLPKVERASVQLSGSDWDLTRPIFVHMELRKPHLSRCGHAQAVHVFVCQ